LSIAAQEANIVGINLKTTAEGNEVSVADLPESPYFLFSSTDEIVETLQMRRERSGISCFAIFGEENLESFAPVLTRLAGA
jgi:hypothetical protein